MKNFWIMRRKKRQLAKIAEIVQAVLDQKQQVANGIQRLNGVFPWRRKNVSRTQP